MIHRARKLTKTHNTQAAPLAPATTQKWTPGSGTGYELGFSDPTAAQPAQPHRGIYLAYAGTNFAAVVPASSAAAPASAPFGEIVDSPERAAIPENLKWNFELVYPNMAAWERELHEVEQGLKHISARGQIDTSSGQSFYRALEAIDYRERQMYKVFVFAQSMYHTHMDNPRAKDMFGRAQKLESAFGEATAFLKPAILALSDARLKKLRREEPRLDKDFGHYLDRIIAQRAHTLTAEQAKVEAKLAGNFKASENAGATRNIFDTFIYTVMPRSKVRVSDSDKPVEATLPNYSKYRGSPNRGDRKAVTEAFFGDLKTYEDLFASIMNEKVLASVREAGLHGYDSPLQASLADDDTDPNTYKAFLAGIEGAQPAMHRYTELRKRMLGVDELRTYDLYASAVPGAKTEYSIPEAKDIILKALAPLGNDYIGRLQQGFKDRWVDFSPHTGKQGGAYLEEKYPEHPFVLVNFEGSFDSVGTVAHELGHAIHTVLTAENNKAYAYAKYPYFIAEVPSTVNQLLTIWYQIDHATSPAEKLAALMNLMEIYRQSAFRQAQFSRFENAMNEKVKSGGTLTADFLDKTYSDIVRETYGPALVVDELAGSEWAFIPHFNHYNFYVQNYSTCFVAALSIARRIRNAEPGVKQAYLKMLGKGGSEDPVKLLKDIGVDMTTTKPYEDLATEMGRALDMIEALWKETQVDKKQKN